MKRSRASSRFVNTGLEALGADRARAISSSSSCTSSARRASAICSSNSVCISVTSGPAAAASGVPGSSGMEAAALADAAGSAPTSAPAPVPSVVAAGSGLGAGGGAGAGLGFGARPRRSASLRAIGCTATGSRPIAFCITRLSSGRMSALILPRMGARPSFAIPWTAFPATAFTPLATFLSSLPRKSSNAGSSVEGGAYRSAKDSISPLNQFIVTRAELPGHRVDHRLRFTNQIGEVLRDDAIGVLQRMAGGEVVRVQVAGVGQQLEERFVELFVVELLDHGDIGLANRILERRLSLYLLVDGEERRPWRTSRWGRHGALALFADEAWLVDKGRVGVAVGHTHSPHRRRLRRSSGAFARNNPSGFHVAAGDDGPMRDDLDASRP